MGGGTAVVQTSTASSSSSDDGLLRELRIAPVMTGGTSLAVWIGGVTAELYRVVTAREASPDGSELYRWLLDLTRTDAKVDVITGTSAGGLNGVLLATAWTRGTSLREFLKVRDTWMRLGALDSLLRSPSERNPPSLLRGDDYFWPRLAEELERLAAAGDPAVAREVDLAVTVTTLSAEPSWQTDDFGQLLGEASHGQHLRFDETDFRGDAAWARRIALAARTSASIPGVFEASYLPLGSEGDAGRPGFSEGQASFGSSRWAVDGGVVDNLPLQLAMDRVVRRKATSDFRRVALYVNPTPRTALAPPAAAEGDVPTIRQVIQVLAGEQEGVSAEVERLHARNREAERAIDLRVSIGALVADGGADLVELANALYGRFPGLRVERSVAASMDANWHGSTTNDEAARARVQAKLVEAAQADDTWLPPEFDPDRPDWPWGIAPVEEAARLLVDLIRDAYLLPLDMLGGEERMRLGQLRGAVDDLVHGDADSTRTSTVDTIRALDGRFWSSFFDLPPALAASSAGAAYAAWPNGTDLGLPGRWDHHQAEVRAALGEHASTLAVLGQAVVGVIGADGERRARLPTSMQWLVAVLWPADEEAPDAGTIRRRFVALHVMATLFGAPSRREPPIELLEISWRAPNALVQRAPDQKLAGHELSRLGAFVKASWRANDWMWGRMDGAYQLVLLLADPARLVQLGAVEDFAERVVVHLERRRVDKREDSAATRAVAAELDALRSGQLPRSLPACAEVLAEAVQLEIARGELPQVHAAVQRDLATAAEGDGGYFRLLFERTWRGAASDEVRDVDVIQVFDACRIGEETTKAELSQSGLARSMGTAAMVAANALTGERSGVQVPGRVMSPLRLVAMAMFVVSRLATASTRLGIAAAAFVFGTAAAIVAFPLVGGDVPAGLVVLAAVILVLGTLVATLRSGLWSQWPVVVGTALVALTFVGDELEPVLIGTSSSPWWKRWVFTNAWSLVVIVILILSTILVVSVARRVGAMVRGARFDPATGRRGRWSVVSTAALLAVAVLVPVVLVLQDHFFDFLTTGKRRGWRRQLLRAAELLAERNAFLVIAVLLLLGIVLGMGWDRLWRLAPARLRSLVRVRARTAISEFGPPPPFSTPAETWPVWFRCCLVPVGLAAAIVGLVRLSHRSDLLAQHGVDYIRFQVSFRGAPEHLAAWRAAGEAAAARSVVVNDFLFALGYGLVSVLVASIAAELVGRRGRWRTATLLGVASWMWLGAASADLLENAFFLKIVQSPSGAELASSAVAASSIGLLKWWFVCMGLVLTFGAPILARWLNRPVAPSPDPAGP